MTGRILHGIRCLASTPAWAVHFHSDPSGSRPCFDARCGRPPLSTDYRLG